MFETPDVKNLALNFKEHILQSQKLEHLLSIKLNGISSGKNQTNRLI